MRKLTSDIYLDHIKNSEVEKRQGQSKLNHKINKSKLFGIFYS